VVAACRAHDVIEKVDTEQVPRVSEPLRRRIVGSPLGWLWLMMIATAPTPVAGWNTSRGWIREAVAVPTLVTW